MKKTILTILIMSLIIIQPVFCGEWYNFKTEQYETIDGEISDYSLYLPQYKSAQGLYDVYTKMGDTPSEAFIKVSELLTGTAK